MTRAETTAYNAGIETVRQMALIAAVSLEVRDDGQAIRQKAAAAALLGLADGAKTLLLNDEPGGPACSLPDINRHQDGETHSYDDSKLASVRDDVRRVDQV